LENLAIWYIQRRPIYESLLEIVKSIIESLLRRESTVRYYQVQARVKAFDSFQTKLYEKKYVQPEEIKDFAALRVICYLRQDKEIVAGLLEDNFRVMKRDDKSLDLGVDKIGYNSIHLDAMLKNDRASLAEHELYKDLKFEIQITTILQHTYAEIEHDLIYKTGNVLPEKIQRSINTTSAELESLDEKFERIMNDIDTHNKNSFQKVEKGELDLPIDSPSLRRYLLKNFGDLPDFKPQFGSVNDTFVIDQLHSMGINTLSEFERIIPANFKEKYCKIPESKYGVYITGLVVWFLIIRDHKKYFKEAYKESYGIFDSHDFHVFKEFGVDISEFPRDVIDCD
jgi:putative GTP pyrophosphokinase